MSVWIIEKFQRDTRCNSNVSMLSQNYAGCLQIQWRYFHVKGMCMSDLHVDLTSKFHLIINDIQI